MVAWHMRDICGALDLRGQSALVFGVLRRAL